METTLDGVLGGRLQMRQPKRGYRIAIDPILLAAAVPARAGERVIDAGCGVGTAGLALARRVDGLDLTGLELQDPLAVLATENAETNGLAGVLQIVGGDILSPPESLRAGTYDHVIANPPYMKAGEATPPPDQIAAKAVIEANATLEDWVAFAAQMLRPAGRATLIHRADRLPDLARTMARHRFGDIRIFPLWPNAAAARGEPETDARRVIVAGVLGGSGPTQRLDGMVLHDADGGFMAEAEAVLRHAGPIVLQEA